MAIQLGLQPFDSGFCDRLRGRGCRLLLLGLCCRRTLRVLKPRGDFGCVRLRGGQLPPQRLLCFGLHSDCATLQRQFPVQALALFKPRSPRPGLRRKLQPQPLCSYR